MIDNSYKMFIHDGLNEYYVAEESWDRTVGFEERAVTISYHALRQHQFQSWSDDSRKLKKYVRQAENYEALIRSLREKISELENAYSLAESKTLQGKNLLQRVKIAAEGLTTDWYEFKKKHQ